MARAPETGFYFEPVTERLALVVEGSPFPTDDHWAWLGDPIDMTPQQAQLVVAVRWPGVDPDTLEVEFDLNFERAVAEADAQRRERDAGVTRVPLEFDVDIDQLLSQAETLRDQVRQVSLHDPSPQAHDAAVEAESLRALLEKARALTAPAQAGHAMNIVQAPPQSMSLTRAAELPESESAPLEPWPFEQLPAARAPDTHEAPERKPRASRAEKPVASEQTSVPAATSAARSDSAPTQTNPLEPAKAPARKRPNIRKG